MRVGRIVFILLLISMIGLSAWLWWRDSKSYQSPIPHDAETVLKISTDELLWEAVKYTITHPSDWVSEQDTLKDDQSVTRGLEFPANIFAFNRKSAPGIFYLSVPVSDTSAAKVYLKNVLDLGDYVWKDNTWQASSKNRQFTLGIDDSYATIGFRAFTSDNAPGANNLSNNIRSTTMSDSLRERLKATQGNMAIMNQYMELGIDFSGDMISLQGKVDKKIGSKEARIKQVFPIDFSEYMKPLKMMVDSSERMQIYIAGIHNKMDTIITYEFNEDFEKVEKKSINEKKVPGIYIRTSGNFPADRREELSGALNKMGLKILGEKESTLYISNTNTYLKDIPFDYSYLNIEVDVNSIKEVLPQQVSGKWAEKVNTIKLTIDNKDDYYNLEGSIELNNHIIEIVKKR